MCFMAKTIFILDEAGAKALQQALLDANSKDITAKMNAVTISSDGYLVVNGVKQTACRLIGPAGTPGTNGTDGKDGTPGTNGTNGKDGVTPTLKMGTITTGEPGTQATAELVPNGTEYTLNLTIPQGPQGPQGTPGTNGTNGTNATTTAVATESANGLMSAAMVKSLMGQTTAATLASLPVTHKEIVATISGASSLSLSSIPANGTEIHVVVFNSTGADITVGIPNSGNYVSFSGDSLNVPANGYAEINVIIANGKALIRAAA